jgi:hypothetical protein
MFVHDKYFEILEFFLNDYHKDIYGRGLVDKVKLSQKTIALSLIELEKLDILKMKKRGNMKFYSLNHSNGLIKDYISQIELSRKINFFKKNPVLSDIFKSDDRIVGLFERYSESNQSDAIDVFIIGKKKESDYNSISKMFYVNLNIKYFSISEFNRLMIKKHQEIKRILDTHVLIFGIDRFVDLVYSNNK